MTSIPRPRRVSALVLVVVAAILLLPLLPAFGVVDCFCDETMCIHRHRHPGGGNGDSHSTHTTPSARANGSAHCDLAAKTAPDCVMRGCSHDGDHALPSLGLGALTPIVAMAAPTLASALDVLAPPPLLDRSPSIETPPPDAFPV